jgi:MarR family 2-MHQ and catechol resistance regulon transcriptional repressor
LGKAFREAAKYLYAGLEETGIDDTDFRILEALLKKVPLPVNTIGPKVYLTPRKGVDFTRLRASVS